MIFSTDIRGPRVMDHSNFGSHMTFYLGQNSNLSSTLVYDQVQAKLLTFSSATAVLSLHCY